MILQKGQNLRMEVADAHNIYCSISGRFKIMPSYLGQITQLYVCVRSHQLPIFNKNSK